MRMTGEPRTSRETTHQHNTPDVRFSCVATPRTRPAPTLRLDTLYYQHVPCTLWRNRCRPAPGAPGHHALPALDVWHSRVAGYPANPLPAPSPPPPASPQPGPWLLTANPVQLTRAVCRAPFAPSQRVEAVSRSTCAKHMTLGATSLTPPWRRWAGRAAVCAGQPFSPAACPATRRAGSVWRPLVAGHRALLAPPPCRSRGWVQLLRRRRPQQQALAPTWRPQSQ